MEHWTQKEVTRNYCERLKEYLQGGGLMAQRELWTNANNCWNMVMMRCSSARPRWRIFRTILKRLGKSKCKQHTALRTHHTRNFFSRVAQAFSSCVVSPKKVLVSRACHISHLACSTSSSLLFLQSWANSCGSSTGLLFAVLPNSLSSQVMNPALQLRWAVRRFTLVLLPSNKEWECWPHHCYYIRHKCAPIHNLSL